MGILSSLYTGVSGIAAQGEALGVIGDNIANANTTGFTASRAEFQDIVAKSLKGILGGNKHLVNMFLTKTADPMWNYFGLVDGKEITGAKEDEQAKVCEGQVSFTTD